MNEQLTPESRLEKFLSSIAYNTEIPEDRRNRLERWLGAILKRNPAPDAPYDRLELWLKAIYDNADLITEFSGTEIEFWSNVEKAIESLIVDIEPYQDLHGYDHPWPGGSGKNIVFVSSGNNMIIANVKAEKTYTFSLMIREGGGVGVNLKKQSSTGDIIASANPYTKAITFTVDEDCGIYLNGFSKISGTSFSDFAYNLQIEEGSTATPYSPYSNICPISGWTGATIKRYGVDETDNLLTVDVDWETEAGTVYGGTLNVTTGVLTVTHGSIRLGECEWFFESGDYLNVSHVFNTSSLRGRAVQPQDANIAGDLIASCYQNVSQTTLFLSKTGGLCSLGPGVLRVIDLRYETAGEFTAAIADQTFVFQLLRSITYQLTPQEVRTLLGVNHINAVIYNATEQRDANITISV